MRVKSNLFSLKRLFWAVEILFENAIGRKQTYPGNTSGLDGANDFSMLTECSGKSRAVSGLVFLLFVFLRLWNYVQDRKLFLSFVIPSLG